MKILALGRSAAGLDLKEKSYERWTEVWIANTSEPAELCLREIGYHYTLASALVPQGGCH